jgi:hypothetical protein
VGKLKTNQAGFTVVEVLLTLIFIAIVVFIGVYIAHNHKTDTTPPKTSTKSSTTSTTSSNPNKGYFVIKEWGLRAKYSGNLTLEYKITPDTGTPSVLYARFSSTQLDAQGATCKSSGDYGGIISRYLSTSDILSADGSDTGQTAAQFAPTQSSSTYSHVGNYYYFFSRPQGVCNAAQSAQNVQSQTVQAVEQLAPNLETEPSS